VGFIGQSIVLEQAAMINADLQRLSFPEPTSAEAKKYKSRTVFCLGKGPGVVLMHELPGLTEYVANFGRAIAAEGYTIYMPVMFGIAFPEGVGRSVNALGVCINREFMLFSKRTSSPITDWLRALCSEVHERCGGPGVAAIGLCLSGGFVLSMMVDKSVIAPVMSEPSLPICLPRDWQKASQAALGISPEELETAKQRSRAEDIPVIGLRFSNDWICPARRFETLEQQFGDHFIKIEIPSEKGNPYEIPATAHSVLTEDYHSLKKYIELFPDKDPRKQVIAFLDRQLKEPSR
jgi:dienelactone hydrolase